MLLMSNKKDVSLTVFCSVEPNNSILDEGECKDGDAIPPESSTKDGKLYRGRKSEESESAHEVKKKKEIDPYKGTGAIPKRPKQGKSSKPETSSSKDTLAEETDKSKEKNHEFSKDKILPYAVEGGPDNNFHLYCETHGKTNLNHSLGLVVGSDGLLKSYHVTDCLHCSVCWVD